MVENVQKAMALSEMGTGLLSRIYFMKSKLVSDKRQLYMGPDYLHRFRVMITENFPKIPSRKKLKEIPGGESFASNAVNNCRVLSSYRDLVYDMVDFAVNSSAVLSEMPKSSVLTTLLERNREVVQCYLDLLKTYVRVMTFFSTLKEGKTLYALYAASVHYLHHMDEHSRRMSLGGHVIEKKYTENANILFSHMEDPQRHFIDTFNADLCQYLKPMLLNMRVTLWAGEDLLALEGRKVFDPVNAGSHTSAAAAGGTASGKSPVLGDDVNGIDRNVLDTQPSVMPLNTESSLDLYSELSALQAYKENVVFACLAAPSLLLEPDVLDLLRHIIEHTMVLPIFRDFNLMIHVVLETLTGSFPDPALDPLIIIPKGYKLKTTLKHIARHATMTCSYYHAQRRVYLTGILQRIYALLEQSPGLVGPKMPLITAVASLSREEILWYYRHLGKVKIRKDCKKFHNPDLYIAYDIAEIVGELCRVTASVRRYQKLIVNYYSEYLSGLHFKRLIPMLETVSSQLDARITDFGVSASASASLLSDEVKYRDIHYLKNIMNPLVEDLVRATTNFSQRPDFKAMYRNKEGSDNQTSGGVPVGEVESDGLDMDLFRMHPEDRKISRELRNLAEDPLAAATKAAAAANSTGIHAVSLITGDIRRLDSFRRNWFAAADHLNRALEILTLESNEELEAAKKGDETAIQSLQVRRKDTLTILMSASQLLAHMRTLINHSYYVDSLPSVFEHYFEPHDVWWFRDSFFETFYDCIEGESEDGKETKYSLAFLWFPSLALRSLHSDCPQEASPLVKAVMIVTENMIEDFLEHFGHQFAALSAHIDGFKQQSIPLEAAHRLQRMIAARDEEEKGGDIRVAEPYPGFESRPANKDSAHAYATVKSNVIHLVKSASEFGQINVHDRHYTISAGLIEKATEIIEDALVPTFFDGVHNTDVKDITDAYRIHHSAMCAFQVVVRHTDVTHSKLIADKLYSLNSSSSSSQQVHSMSHRRHPPVTSSGNINNNNNNNNSSSGLVGGKLVIDDFSDLSVGQRIGPTDAGTGTNTLDGRVTFDLGKWYRDLLFMQSSDPTVPFPGTHLPTSARVGGNTLAWKYSIWFSGLASQIASGRSGLVYLPQLNSIGSLTRFKHNKNDHRASSRRKRGSTLAGVVDDDDEDDGEDVETEKVASTSYVTVPELCSMCMVIGPHGVRTIDSQLLRILCYMVNTDILGFVQDNADTLRTLAAKCSVEGGVEYAHNNIIGMHRFLDALTTVGFIITLRRMLYQAQGEVINQFSPSVSDILLSVCATLDPLIAPRGGCSSSADLASLVGAYSNPREVDLPVLIALEKECFDPCPVFKDQKVRNAPSLTANAPSSLNKELLSYVLNPNLGPSRRGSILSELSNDGTEAADNEGSWPSGGGGGGTSTKSGNYSPTKKRSGRPQFTSSLDGEERDGTRHTESAFSTSSSSSSYTQYTRKGRVSFASGAKMDGNDFYSSLAYGSGASSSTSTKFIDTWEMLPAALASVFLSDLWEHTHYFVSHDCFSHNEHLLPEACSTLLMACMGRDGYAQYLHILKVEREKQDRLATDREREASNQSKNGGAILLSDSSTTNTDSGVNGATSDPSTNTATTGIGNGDSGINFVEQDMRRISAATLVSAAAASQAGRALYSPAGGVYVPSENAYTDRSLIRAHLQTQAESVVRISANILLYLLGKGRLSANKIMAEAMTNLKKGTSDASGISSAELAEDDSPNNDSTTSASDSRAMYRELYSSGRAPTMTKTTINDAVKADKKDWGGGSSEEKEKEKEKGKEKEKEKENDEKDKKMSDRERHRSQSLNPQYDDSYDDFSMRPVSGMARCLEKFVSTCPVASRAMLEAYYPYSLVHAGLTDAALGKLRELDERKAFPEKR